MTLAFSDLYSQPTLAQAKASVIDIAEAAGLRVTSWILGEPSERWIEIVSRAMDAFLSAVTTQAIRGFFLDLATDPGDDGDLAEDQTPRAGWLSALGEGWYGTTRRGETFATGTVTVTNDGTAPVTFSPFDLTFQRGSADPDDGSFPTYRNAGDSSIYVGLAGSVTMQVGATLVLPVVADQIGTYANAQADDIDEIVTGTGLTIVSSGLTLGSDREDRDEYIARCRQAAAAASPAGPADAYRYAATTAKDGTPLQNHDGSGPVAITRVQLLKPTGTGSVTVYLGRSNGAPLTVEVQSAGANIFGTPLGEITDPIGVVPDGVTCNVVAGTEVDVPVAGSVKIKRRPGMTDLALQTAVKTAIVDALGVEFTTFPIAGFDQDVGGNGVIYTGDFVGVVDRAYPGTYQPLVTTPAGSSTALNVGEIAVLDSAVGDWTVTVTS